ncbi:protein FAM169B-like [Hetaerina americana]|uniref:protein FAM169B-like n=1 Tax=Hetaerina americana TaxID=62018 RepID=UPI003A7F2160
MICSRCRNPLQKYSVIRYLHHSIDVSTITCPACDVCIGINLKGKWKNVDQVLGSGGERNGWIEVSSVEDKAVHFVLSKVLYEQYEPPDSHNFESPYDLPESSDVVKILWCKGIAVGFYTLKLKGTWNEEMGSKYEMNTLDTAYIRNSHRRKGYGTSILYDLVNTYPGENVGLSKPISNSMRMVLSKFLSQHTQYRLNFWEIEGSGSEGFRTLVWYSMKSKRR